MPASSSGSGWAASGRRPASSRGEHAGRPGRSRSAYGHVELAEPVEQLAERVVVLRGVLADVERGEREPGGGDGAHQPLELAPGDQLALVLAHRAVQQEQVVEQLGVVAVVAARPVRLAAPGSGPR